MHWYELFEWRVNCQIPNSPLCYYHGCCLAGDNRQIKRSGITNGIVVLLVVALVAVVEYLWWW